VEQLVVLFRHVAEEIRQHLAALGARSIDEIIGRGDLLTPIDPEHEVAREFTKLLVRADYDQSTSFRTVARSPVGEQLAVEGRRAARARAPIELSYPVSNTDRAVGTRLSGEIADLVGEEDLDDDTITVRFSGTAGQSFGAFLAAGVTMRLVGVANDFVGKGMGGGTISIRPHEVVGAGPHAAGNACLYGATGGRLYAAGSVGQRFAVRNSGGVAVVEGTSDHCAEYMTGGTVVVLGPTGDNVAAGMTGGTLFLWDPESRARGRLSSTAPTAQRPDPTQLDDLRALLSEHVAETASAVAMSILANWEAAASEFWLLEAATATATATETATAAAGAPAAIEITATTIDQKATGEGTLA
jgi:glutamate synthase domain-containing protein 3